MARAAVKAKQQAQKQKKAAQPAPRRTGRRGHASGGNPNQQLFFIRLRRKAKPAYLVLAVLFGVTFAFLGVGSGANGGLDQLFSGLNIFSSGGTSISKAQKEIQKHPNEAKGYRDLATAYEGKNDTANAISALQQYTVQKPKDVSAWNELGGLQLTQAQDYLAEYRAASQATQLAYTNAVGSYQKVTKLQPNNASAWFQLAQTAQQSGDVKTAVAGYKRYL